MSLYDFNQVINMRKRTRHRLFGAVILTLIGMIIFPMVFDQSRYLEKESAVFKDVDAMDTFVEKVAAQGVITTGFASRGLDMQLQKLTLDLDEGSIFNEEAPMVNGRQVRGFSGFSEPEVVVVPMSESVLKQDNQSIVVQESSLGETTQNMMVEKVMRITEEVDKKSVRADTEEIRSIHSFQKKGVFLLILDSYKKAGIDEESLNDIKANGYHIDWMQHQTSTDSKRFIVMVGPYATKTHANSELVRLGKMGFGGRVFKK